MSKSSHEILDAVIKNPEKLQETLESLKRKHKKNICRYCSEEIEFREAEDGKSRIPYDLDGTPHWKTCISGKFVHKQMALKMVQKFGIYFLLKHGIDLVEEVNFTPKEAQVMRYILDRALKEYHIEVKNEPGKIEPVCTDETIKEGLRGIEENAEQCKVDELQLKGDDPIGDPDEDLTVPEEIIEELEKQETEEK